MPVRSSGQIDARNPIHSARGLFQLTRVTYHLNPDGEASFGNGVEEAQGGIRTDVSDPSGRSIAMFLAGDQLLKGAALNAAQIAERLVG